MRSACPIQLNSKFLAEEGDLPVSEALFLNRRRDEEHVHNVNNCNNIPASQTFKS
jgi:hypothetical protein